MESEPNGMGVMAEWNLGQNSSSKAQATWLEWKYKFTQFAFINGTSDI